MPEETSTASGSGSAEEKPCSSTAAAETSGDVMEEAKKLIGTGKRHLVMGDVVSAVNVFQEACSMLAAKYGDTADECGEAFFLCGKSLLELARMENGVLGNALEGVPEESEEEEQPKNPNLDSADNLDEKTREELRKQVCDAMAEKEKTEVEPKEEVENENSESEEPVDPEAGETSSSAAVVEEKSSVQATEEDRDASAQAVKEEEEEDEGIEESNAEAEQTDETSEDDDDDEDEDEENNTQDNEEEDVGNLQLAWEMLEVAKVIFKKASVFHVEKPKKESKDDQLMAAQAYLKLGEVSAETGNYPQALEDFQECLTLQLKLLPPHCRLLAETHYHVATTLVSMDQYNQAIQHYNSSVKVIETRLAMLQEVIDAAAGDDGAAEEKSELEELKQLLPEIREKVEDAKESQRTASAASQAIQQTLGAPSTSSTFPCENGGPSSSTAFVSTSQIPVKTSESALSSKAVSDISHLVRKKRKPEEESPVKDADAKQLKQEATVNGSGDSSASNSSETQEGKSKESAAVESSS